MTHDNENYWENFSCSLSRLLSVYSIRRWFSNDFTQKDLRFERAYANISIIVQAAFSSFQLIADTSSLKKISLVSDLEILFLFGYICVFRVYVSTYNFRTMESMKACSDDNLVEVATKNWRELRDVFASNWPKNHIAWHTVNNYLNWFRIEPRIRIMKIYSLNGTWRSDGTIVVIVSILKITPQGLTCDFRENYEIFLSRRTLISFSCTRSI